MKNINKVLSAIFALTIGSTLITPVYHAGTDDNEVTKEDSSSSLEHFETDSDISPKDFDDEPFFDSDVLKSAEESERETRKITFSFNIDIYGDTYGIPHSDDDSTNALRIGLLPCCITTASKRLKRTILSDVEHNSDAFANLCLNYDFMSMSNYGYDLSTYSVRSGSSTLETVQKIIDAIKRSAERMGCEVEIDHEYDHLWIIEIQKDL